MLRCTTDEFFFWCWDSVAADFKNASTRPAVVPQAQPSCWNLRRQHREATALGRALGRGWTPSEEKWNRGARGFEVLKNAAVGVEPTANYKNHNSKIVPLTTHLVID